MSDSNSGIESKTVVYNDDVKARPAPILEVGAIAWIRQNLFKTWMDVFLTISGITIAILITASFVLWAINSANWWSVSFNFRQFMLGRYEAIYEWRVVIATIVTVFCCGMAVAVWIRKISRLATITVVSLLILLFIVPVVIVALIPMPEAFVATTAGRIAVGSALETPPSQLAFTGKAGEEITIRRANDLILTDEALVGLHGFMDSGTNLMRTAAINRQTALAREAELRDLLARDSAGDIPIFTQNQRTQREAELGRIEITPSVVETYQLGQPTVTVTVLVGATAEALSSPVRLASDADSATFVLPQDGWYILQMDVPEAEEGIVILAVKGIYPIIRSTALAESEDGAVTTGFASAYIRMTDNFQVSETLPSIDDEEITFYNIVNNQYRGSRPLDTYLRVYLAPFLEKLSVGMAILLLAGVAGYWFVALLKRLNSQKFANRMTAYAMILLPPFIWIMASGVSIPELFNSSLAISSVLFVLFMFYMGNYFGTSLLSIGVLLIATVGITLLPFFVFDTQYGIGLLPLVNLLIFLPAFLALMAGSATYGAADIPVVRRNFFIVGVLLIAFIIVPKILLQTDTLDLNGDYADWFMASSDQRRWGGLLLTMVLTIFGIIVAFPIGVALALGRRSKLPAIKYGCTLYIELVRGSPFIAVLFMMQLMIPLINPAFTQIPGTVRALIAVIIFSAAYLAENVRGGLQSLPPGQNEAARALGLAGWQTVFLITLPQALRAVIPALVGQFIALFKDTSLVAIVGLTDLTGFVSIMTVQAEFIGTRAEGLVFITLIYFVFSYVMAYVSRLLEASGSGSTRRT